MLYLANNSPKLMQTY